MSFAVPKHRLAEVYAFLYSVESLAPIFIRTHEHHFLRQSSAWCEIFRSLDLARDRVEPPTPAFSELIVPVFPTTSMVAVGLLNTGKYEKNEWIVGDRRG